MILLAALLLAPCSQDPLAGQLPKQDLGVEAFLAAHPEYDGRGIRVAVLDTGVDPGHPFLQQTPGGRRKIVDWFDATTDGRLDTSMTAQAANGSLVGLTGRRLKLGVHAAPNRVFHLGRIGIEFLPEDLQHRVMEQREARWREGRRVYREGEERRAVDRVVPVGEAARRAEEAWNWEEFRDRGPAWDLLLWQENSSWRVAIDQDEDGDLGEERALQPFRTSGEWAVLGDETLLNYAVDVEDDGRRAVLFFDANGHGTHVAGIIGSWEGPGGRLNGLAPGVEIVAIKIGDGKYGGSTSGFAIAKGLDYAVQAGCQVANMSFGGPSFFADGREPEAIAVEEAAKRGLFLVCSAGNEGPTLSTVGSPATVPHALAVAAAVWPDTQLANYASLDPSAAVMFDFSSRGPLPTGALGVDFAAPGAALSPLPSWTLSHGENFNGTSMASPQMAACVALLRCAARAESLPQDWARLYRALRLSAEPIAGFTWVDFGHGAIRMEAALEALRLLAEDSGAAQEFEVAIENEFGSGPGIYERRDADGAAFDRTVRVAPHFAAGALNAEKAAYLHSFRVRSEAPWVETPDAVYLNAAGKSFTVRVRTEGLEPGLHSTRILLSDADAPSGVGADLIVPVTLVLAERADAEARYQRRMTLAPGGLERIFLVVPYGARSARVEIRQEGAGRNELRLGAGTVSGFLYAGDRQLRGRHVLEDGGLASFDAPVEAGTIWELAIAARWSSNQASGYAVTIRFDGVVPQNEVLVVPAGQDTAYLAIKSPLRDLACDVTASIDGVAIPLLAEPEVRPDPLHPVVFDDLGMYQGVVEQVIEVPEGGAAAALHLRHSIQSIEIREDLMVELFDAEGAIVARKIAYEIETDLGQLAAGSYRLRLIYPAMGRSALEARYAGAELRLATGGGKLRLFSSIADALHDENPNAKLSLLQGGARSIFGRLPKLGLVDDGRSYYGSLTVKAGGVTVLSLPLRVERPQSGVRELAPGPAPSVPGETEKTYLTQRDDAAATPAARVAAARAWAAAEPRTAAAALAVLSSLHGAGLDAAARQESRDFLRRFPRRAEELLAEAARWGE
jgi:tripeptidyl-peptidase-2